MHDNDSKCLKDPTSVGLCDFQRVGEYPDALVEVCNFCGKKVIYNIRDRQVDNAKYMRDHLRDTLQPYGVTGNKFEQAYGMAKVKETEKFNKIREEKGRSANEIGEEAKDMIKTLQRTSVNYEMAKHDKKDQEKPTVEKT